ncbi:MAG TPA: peroxiredoxin [Hyphomicrobiales bacterium]|nr:peroxiredoxin [Hyphomicrobiales bacterium]
MTIQTGERIPQCTLRVMGEKGPEKVETSALFDGKKVVMFAVPGAFTPGCSKTHLPGYVALADKIKAKGVDSIICLAVNDAFVMDAWGKAKNASEVIMLADGNAEFTRAMGLEMDGSGNGMGTRCKRMAMIVEDGVVRSLTIEPPGGIVETTAEATLERL